MYLFIYLNFNLGIH